MTNREPVELAVLYIHIPFCMRKCPYCDFYSVTELSLMQPFLEALMREMTLTRQVPIAFDSLYIGGGTPSVFGPQSIANVLDKAHRCFNFIADTEITLEVNPGMVDPERFKGYRSAGVNRINIGVQSFLPPNLKFLDRIHTAQEAKQALRWARKAGFDNIGLDLIYGIPGQTRKSWLLDLQKAMEHVPEHLSCYMLTYESGTPLERNRSEGRFDPMREEMVGDLFETTTAFLSANGYAPYEISSFARCPSESDRIKGSSDNRSRHNRKYWSFVPYIGLGPAAHSYIEPMRYWNQRSLKKYIREIQNGRIPVAGKETLSRSQQMIEVIYLGLRTTDGIDMDYFSRKFGISFFARFEKRLSDLEARGLIRFDRDHCALSSKGMLFLDSIASMFVSQEME
jgi:oxygen-independent coproporphyrinogen-3 oxidase